MSLRVAKYLGVFLIIILVVLIFVYLKLKIEYNSKCPSNTTVKLNIETVGF